MAGGNLTFCAVVLRLRAIKELPQVSNRVVCSFGRVSCSIIHQVVVYTYNHILRHML